VKWAVGEMVKKIAAEKGADYVKWVAEKAWDKF
jgi:hypothetical protein